MALPQILQMGFNLNLKMLKRQKQQKRLTA
jgi:hypothetical protein